MKRTFLVTTLAALALALAYQNLPAHADDGEVAMLRARRNGDVNGDELRDLSDVIYLLGHFFQGGPAPVEIEPAEETVPEEFLLGLQEDAAQLLTQLPTAEQIAAMPEQLQRYFRKYRRIVQVAAETAPNWRAAQVHRFHGNLEMVAVLEPIIRRHICDFLPVLCVDQECLDRCEAEHIQCNGLCSPFDLNCQINCTTEFLICSSACYDFSHLIP